MPRCGSCPGLGRGELGSVQTAWGMEGEVWATTAAAARRSGAWKEAEGPPARWFRRRQAPFRAFLGSPRTQRGAAWGRGTKG